MSKWFLKGFIFIALFFVRLVLFDPEQGGPLTGLIFLSDRILGMSVANEGASAVTMIFSFIITVVVYYVIAEIVTLIIMSFFGKKEQKK